MSPPAQNKIENENAAVNVFTNAGHLEVKAGAELQLASDTVSNSGVITVDSGATPAQLTLTSTTITQTASLGSITNSGTVTLAGTDTIDNGALDNTSTGHIYVTGLSNEIENENSGVNVFTNAGHLEVKAGAELQLASDTVSNSGVITVDSGATPAQLTLTSTTITQTAGLGSITNSGTVTLAGTDTIDNGALDNTSTGHIYVTGLSNKIENENSAVNVFTNAGHLEVKAGAELQLPATPSAIPASSPSIAAPPPS